MTTYERAVAALTASERRAARKIKQKRVHRQKHRERYNAAKRARYKIQGGKP